MNALIDINIKRKCVELFKSGMTTRQVFDEYFSKVHSGQSYTSFRVSLQRWKKKSFADDLTLNAGTYSWHNKNGYVGNHKRFQIFEYSHDRLTDIHYV